MLKYVLVFAYIFLSMNLLMAREMTIPGKEGGLSGLSLQWLTTPLNSVKIPMGTVESQIFIRYFPGKPTFQTGSIVYYTFPNKKGDKSNLNSIAESFKKVNKLKTVLISKFEKDVWIISAPAENLTKGLFYTKLFYFKGKNTYAFATSLLRRPYVTDAYAEAEFLQLELMKRARKRDKEISKVSNINWNFRTLWLSNFLIENSYADNPAPAPANMDCIQVPPGGQNPAPTAIGCPSAATCVGLLPPAQAACLADITSCNTNTLNNNVNQLNQTVGNSTSFVNCQSIAWGAKISEVQGWLDTKQQWVDKDVLPLAENFNQNFADAVNLGNRVTSPGYVALLAATGATAAVLASSATNLLIDGISSGITSLMDALTGADEEERMRNEADIFAKAKEKYESLEEDLAKLETALATNVDVLSNVQDIDQSFESLVNDSKDKVGDLRRKQRRAQLEMERFIEDDSDEGKICYKHYDELNASLLGQKESLENVLKALNMANKKYGNFRNMCDEIVRDMDKILAQEYLLDQLRKKLTSYYVSHLWVEQRDRVESDKNDLESALPSDNYQSTIKRNEESFFQSLAQPRIEPQSSDKVDCRSAIFKAARYCYDSKSKWYEGIPLFGGIANLTRNAAEGRTSDLRRCAISSAGALTNKPSNMVEPKAKDFQSLVGYLETRVSSQEFANEGFSLGERLCLNDFVRAYRSFERKNITAVRTYHTARDTFNYRQTNILAEEAYFNDLHDMVNTLNVESACSSIDNTGCVEGDDSCENLRANECTENVLNITCAQLDNDIKSCNAHILPSCRRKGHDDDPTCQYQYKARSRCQSLYKSCKDHGYPVSCEEKLVASCSQDCLSVQNKCSQAKRNILAKRQTGSQVPKSLVAEKNKACGQVKGCESRKKSCRENKLNCMRSSFSKVKHRFGRIMSMRRYLKEGVCVSRE